MPTSYPLMGDSIAKSVSAPDVSKDKDDVDNDSKMKESVGTISNIVETGACMPFYVSLAGMGVQTLIIAILLYVQLQNEPSERSTALYVVIVIFAIFWLIGLGFGVIPAGAVCYTTTSIIDEVSET